MQWQLVPGVRGEEGPGKAGISGLHSRLPRGVRPRLEGKPRQTHPNNLLQILLLLLLSHVSRVRLCATPYGSPPGSPVPGILQARTLEWLVISSSNA